VPQKDKKFATLHIGLPALFGCYVRCMFFSFDLSWSLPFPEGFALLFGLSGVEAVVLS
jgi:hypothetical protein